VRKPTPDERATARVLAWGAATPGCLRWKVDDQPNNLPAMMHWLTQFLDPETLKQLIVIQGPWLLIGVIFAETGLLVGFFLPGDSLLFLAGAFCSVNLIDAGKPAPLSYATLSVSLVLAAFLGNTLNYGIGHLIGERLIRRGNGRIITRARLDQAREFYEHHGALSLLITRFVPIVRTFVPFIAGVSLMRFTTYSFWNILGAVVWVYTLTAAGYFLGQITYVQKHLELIVLAVIAISLLPMAITSALRLRRHRDARSTALAQEAGAT
jgi:membrane-associated protein